VTRGEEAEVTEEGGEKEERKGSGEEEVIVERDLKDREKDGEDLPNI
jgi:hypothetical protein